MARYYIPRLDSDLNAAIIKAYVNMDVYLDKKQWALCYAARLEHVALVNARDKRALDATRKGMNEHPSMKRAIDGR